MAGAKPNPGFGLFLGESYQICSKCSKASIGGHFSSKTNPICPSCAGTVPVVERNPLDLPVVLPKHYLKKENSQEQILNKLEQSDMRKILHRKIFRPCWQFRVTKPTISVKIAQPLKLDKPANPVKPAKVSKPDESEEPEKAVVKKAVIAMKCGICDVYVLPPISACKNKHLICKACKAKSKKCPTCAEEIICHNNYDIDKIAFKTLYPCPNQKYGCTHKAYPYWVRVHNDTCKYRQYHCIMKDFEKCSFFGPKGMLLKHVKESHIKETSKDDRKLFKIAGTVCNLTTSVKAVVYKRHLFLFSIFFRDGNICSYVQYVGPNFFNEFTYKILCFAPNAYEKIVKTYTVLNLTDDIDEAYFSRKLFCIPTEDLPLFVQDGKIDFQCCVFGAKSLLY
ncbi:hypothetical protein C0J52_22804 [Blattella germanica]|nr:hypothetical protein C0J52_22804 [Blattella germanica]